MVEIGPRFILEPIKIFEEFMGGKTVFANPLYVSDNEINREKKAHLRIKYQKRIKNKEIQKQ